MTNNKNHSMSPVSDINVTPFVDVMLTLLIIFMITSPLMQHGLDVNLPQAKSSAMEKSQEDLVLTITKDGSIYFGADKTPVTIRGLDEKLAQFLANREKKDLYIRADENVFYGRVIAVMSVAKAAGVQRIGMITTPVSEVLEKEQS